MVHVCGQITLCCNDHAVLPKEELSVGMRLRGQRSEDGEEDASDDGGKQCEYINIVSRDRGSRAAKKQKGEGTGERKQRQGRAPEIGFLKRVAGRKRCVGGSGRRLPQASH